MNIKTFFTRSIFILLCLLSISAYAADIQVKVDRTQVEVNETFTLIFEANENPDDEPDFSPLEKDFQLLGTSTSSNMSIINGNYTRSKKWLVTLMALHKGTISIPSISFGSDRSPPAQINIKAPQQSTGKQGEAFISELEISNSSVYPQQQIIVTQRLLSSSNINAYEFSPLKIKGVEVTREILGDVKQYQTQRGDTPYLVLEQNHVIYPQSAGQLSIEPSIASARVAIKGNRGNRSTFDPFRNNTKTLRRSSAKKSISVKAIPKAFKGKHWLAAKEVQLVEEFPVSKTFSVGEPITRTLVLMADGQNSSQLPEFITQNVKGLKQYPDKPLLKNNISDTGITGVQQLKVAIIPSSTGQYTLPAISIPWWNTQTNKLEHAQVPARVFSVDSTNQSTSSSTKPPVLNTENRLPLEIDKPEVIAPTDNSTPNTPNNTNDNSLLWKIISLLLAIGLALSLFLLWRKSSIRIVPESEPQINQLSLKQAIKRLKQACDNGDATATKNALLAWANALFVNKSIHSLGDLSNYVDVDLAEKILLLNARLYDGNSTQWTCDELYNLCVRNSELINKQTTQAASKGKLESLYK